MKYSFTKARKLINKTDKDFLDDKINEWKSLNREQNKIVTNCKKEFYLNPNYFYDLFKLILSLKSLDANDLKGHIFEFFKNYRLEGDNPILNKIQVVGFTLPVRAIKRNIEDNYFDHFGNDYTELEIFINSLKTNSYDNMFDFMNIKNFDDVLWITFDENSDDPFSFLRFNSKLEIQHTLALPDFYKYADIFIFTMNLTDENKEWMHKATVFDAGDYCYFSPPKYEEKKYGYTKPLNNGKLRISRKTYVYDKRPEIVCNTREIKLKHISEIKYL